MERPIELSLEQEFSLISFADQVQHMSREQAQQFLVQLHKQMIIRDTIYQNLLKHQWGLDSILGSV
ncbi:NblA/ycf18 family protein [Coleofasciculus sp. FACHB-64]|uniref:NblA/ycf18 family protein n=1 Tax=Cyanophyceae TaxID=3028117 RepID=UPI001681FAA5|nr:MULTISPECIES: NblA/ycf18 family protein [unclassified Coleofasciculus]MBD1838766.1 NblA/ycf18 family protein [Coleofasciculus sp. FACHB-501]MBD1895113.1 NblA/ycf18 family protein [Coleofasciculus sp. FACHB-129]MBD1898439.1 NblA/ycf18 family protein [Coleofasciculus sp. FACHB-125]MBD2048111.1 NblA/ycf18 family protein [Coleofasciculus sp. FACHB-64]MBD2085100.1 NblA/ycf18 family protein [Coleofasciculus sp. FACHB-542]